jgi:hypothetical protein
MNRHAVIVLLPIALVVLSWVQSASAYTYSFCAEADTSFENINIGEDHWVTNTTRPLNGVTATVRYYPGCDLGVTPITYISSELTDQEGCTPSFSTPYSDGCFFFAVWSTGQPRDTAGSYTNLDVLNGSGSVVSTSAWVNPPSSSGTYEFEVTDSPRFQLYAAYGFSVEHWIGSLSGGQINVYDSDSPTTCGCSGSGLRTGQSHQNFPAEIPANLI